MTLYTLDRGVGHGFTGSPAYVIVTLECSGSG